MQSLLQNYAMEKPGPRAFRFPVFARGSARDAPVLQVEDAGSIGAGKNFFRIAVS